MQIGASLTTQVVTLTIKNHSDPTYHCNTDFTDWFPQAALMKLLLTPCQYKDKDPDKQTGTDSD